MKMKKTAIGILIVTMILSFCGCSSDKGEIESLMMKFEHSCNELNIDSMLDCIDPDISEKIKLATEFNGLFTDEESDVLTEELFAVMTGGSLMSANELLPSIKIELSDIMTNMRSGVANAAIEYKIAGESFETEAVFRYTYKNEKWYISSFNLK